MSLVILDVGDASLSYFVAGNGRPVTLLHGFTQSGRSWRELIARMPEGWEWIVPDLRGHGETQIWKGSSCSMDACTEDMIKLWDALEVEKSHLVGYSMGGRLALHIATHRPERVLSVLTIGAHAGLDEDARQGRRQGDEVLASRIERDGLEAFVDYWSSLPLFAGLDVASARRLAATVRNGRFEIVSRAGHAVHQERPEAFSRVLGFHLAAATAVGVSSSSSTSD